MATHGSGCRFQDPGGFSVFMNTGKKKENKCLRCRKYVEGVECDPCEFEDKGYITIDRRKR